MSTKVTSPAGPAGESMQALLTAGTRGALDVRYVGFHPEDDPAVDSETVQPAIAAYLACEKGGLRRTYMRPTQFTTWHFRRDSPSGGITSTFSWLDTVCVEGRLVFRTVNGTDEPAANQDVTVTLRQGSRRIVRHATTDDRGNWDVEIDDPNLVPGPAGQKWAVTAVHTPSSAAVWKAPDLSSSLTVNPINIGAVIRHESFKNPNGQYNWGQYGYPFGVAGGTSFRNAWPTIPLFNDQRDPWLYLDLMTTDRPKFAAMEEAGLTSQIRLDIWTTVRSNLDSQWTARGGIEDWYVAAGSNYGKANAWFNSNHGPSGAGHTQQIRNNAPFTAAGIQAGSGLSGARLIDDNSMAITMAPDKLPQVTGSTWKTLLRRVRGKGVMVVIYWVRVENDAAATRRWVGGAFESTTRSPFHAGGWNPTYKPITFKDVGGTRPPNLRGQTSGGTRTPTHSVPSRATLRYASHSVSSARGPKPGPNAYYGYYSGTWGNQTSTIRFAGSVSAGNVTGGRLTFRNLHTYWNGGADIRLVFGGGQSKVVHVPKSGFVSVTLNQAQARALASSKSLVLQPLDANRNHYGYAAASSFQATFTQR